MAEAPRSQSLRRGGPLPRLWIDSSPSSYRRALYSPSSSTVSSSYASNATTVADTPFGAEPFHVLCIYDFEAEDTDQLSFRKNEVLDIIQREATGWWVAVRPGDSQLGWIPGAFVEPISEAVAHKLRTSMEEPRTQDDGAGVEVSSFPGLSGAALSYVTTPEGENHGYHWLPLLDGDQAPAIRLFAGSDTKDAASVMSPLIPPPEGVDVYHLESTEALPTVGNSSKLDIGYPDAVPARAPAPPVNDSPSGRSKMSHHMQRHSSPLHKLPDAILSEHSRSHSDPASPAISRQLRRRPVLIDDRSSLNRLSTLFESKTVEELDNLLGRPTVDKSFDPLAGGARGFDKSTEDGGMHHDREANASASKQPHAHNDAELQIREDGSVAAGSLCALLERLTDDGIDPAQQSRFQRIFLGTFKTFATSDSLFISLLSRFYMGPPSLNSDEELQQWRENRLEPTQRRVLFIFKLWLQEYWMSRDDPHILRRLSDFLASIPPSSTLASTAQEIVRMLTQYPYVGSPTSPPVTTKRRKRKASKKDFLRTDPALVAKHLCLYEHKLYARIRPQECLCWIKARTDDRGVNLAAFCATRAKLAAWVKTSILQTEAFSRRADVLNFWIKVTEACKKHHNFSSMSALVAGLLDPAITGLQLTWAHVPRGTHLESLMLLNEPASNSSTYGQLQQCVDGPCVPCVEVYLADISHTSEHLADNIILPDSTSLVNFAKRERWYEATEAMLRYQGRSYDFAEDTSVTEFIETNLASISSKDQILFYRDPQGAQ